MTVWQGKPECKIFEQVTGLRVCAVDWDPEVARHEFYRDLAKMICWCQARDLLTSRGTLGELIAEAIGVVTPDNYKHRDPMHPRTITWEDARRNAGISVDTTLE